MFLAWARGYSDVDKNKDAAARKIQACQRGVVARRKAGFGQKIKRRLDSIMPTFRPWRWG